MPRQTLYSQVIRPYLPFVNKSNPDTYEHTFEIDYDAHGVQERYWITEANHDDIIPVIVEGDGVPQEFTDMFSGPDDVLFLDTSGAILYRETIMFDRANKRYKWWVQTSGWFKKSGKLLIRLNTGAITETRNIWDVKDYADKVVPIHADGTGPQADDSDPVILGPGDFCNLTALPEPMEDDPEKNPYEKIHKISFAVVPNPSYKFPDTSVNPSLKGKTLVYPLLAYGPLAVYAYIFIPSSGGLENNPIYQKAVLIKGSGSTAGEIFYDGASLLHDQWDDEQNAKRVYGGSLGWVYVMSWWTSTFYTRIPKMQMEPTTFYANAGSEQTDSGEGVVHATVYRHLPLVGNRYTHYTNRHHIATRTVYSRSMLEASPLELYPALPIAGENIIQSTEGPYKIAEIRFEAEDQFADIEYSKSVDFDPITHEPYYDLNTIAAENEITARTYASLLAGSKMMIYKGVVNLAGIEPPPPFVLPYPNNIEITYQGLSGGTHS